MSLNNFNIKCRLCLFKKEKLIDLSDGLIEKIRSTLNIEIMMKNNWPANICEDCDQFLDNINNFKDSVEKNQNILWNELEVVEIKVEPEYHDYDTEFVCVPKVEVEEPIDKPSKKIKLKKKVEKDKIKRNFTVKKEKIFRKQNICITIEEMDKVIDSFMPLYCDLCEKDGFESLSTVYKHTKIEHKDYKRAFRIRCGLCKNVYDTRSKYYLHILYHQNPDRFKCDQCDKFFRNQANLELHQTSHLAEEDKSLECNICQRRFKLERQLKMHLMYHIPLTERRYKCEQCPKTFITRNNLRDHILTMHTDYRPFVCEICAKKYSTMNQLTTHLKSTHATTQGPKVQCEHCLKFFANGTLLKRHIKLIHIENGPQECTVCGHTSPNLSALKEHTKRQHAPEYNTHPCKFCDKVLRNSKAKKEHEATHTGERLYTCKFCPLEFNSGANKYKHQKEKHPKEWADWHKERNSATPT